MTVRSLASFWTCCVSVFGALFAALFLALALLVWMASLDPPGPSPTPSSSPTGGVGPAVQYTGTAADVTYQGTIAYADESYGPLYLALPEPRGTVATICGPAACITRTSTDYGPDQRVHSDRIADVSAKDFVTICGVPTSIGLCPGSVTIGRRPPVTPPPTDE